MTLYFKEAQVKSTNLNLYSSHFSCVFVRLDRWTCNLDASSLSPTLSLAGFAHYNLEFLDCAFVIS